MISLKLRFPPYLSLSSVSECPRKYLIPNIHLLHCSRKRLSKSSTTPPSSSFTRNFRARGFVTEGEAFALGAGSEHRSFQHCRISTATRTSKLAKRIRHPVHHSVSHGGRKSEDIDPPEWIGTLMMVTWSAAASLLRAEASFLRR